jgi:hypothetical protein
MEPVYDIVKKGLIDSASEEYSYIISIIKFKDTTYIDADFIQYLEGDKAIEAARKLNDVDTIKNEDGTFELGVPGSYYILNQSKKIRRLKISYDCQYDLIYNPDRLHVISGNTLEDLKLIYQDSPFILTLNHSGEIVRIKELFLP